MDYQDDYVSKAFKRAETNLRSKLKPTFLKNYSHHIMPGYNLSCTDNCDIDNIIGLYQEFPYNCDFPKPLLPPAKLSRRILNEEDPALELLSIKSYLNDNIRRMMDYHQKHKKEFGMVNRKDIKWEKKEKISSVKVPRYIAEIASMVEQDPDPYFTGTYNWYYTGGSMNNVHFNNFNVLLFPYLGELIALPVISTEEALWKPIFHDAAKCDLDGAIYDLRYSNNGSSCTILGRYKYHCNFYILSQQNGKLRLNEIHKQTSKIPYVSGDLNTINPHQYCTLNVERQVSLWDVTKWKSTNCNTVMQTKVLDDAWGNIRFQLGDPNIISFVDRCCLHYLDTRMPFDRPALTLCPKFALEKCESLSLDIPSRHNSYTYLAAYHSLVMCDDRSAKQCVQQKWTHQFKSVPLLASVLNRNKEEVIVLSSQIAGENIIILNTWTNEEKSHSFNLPFTPPHIMETLHESQMQGMCLNPYLKSRFNLCNVGSTLIKDNVDNIFFFLQSSSDDIYYQCITHESPLDKYSVVNCKSYCTLDAWDKALSKQNESMLPLTISGKSNMQHIHESFTNKKLRLKHNHERMNDDFEPSWKQSLEKLSCYIDILAPELLAAWDICEEIPMPTSAAPHQKVLSWLESASREDTQSQQEPDYVPTLVNTQELISVSQELDITCLDDSTALQELLLPKVKIKSIRRKKDIRK